MRLNGGKNTCEGPLGVVDVDVRMAGDDIPDPHVADHGGGRGCAVVGGLLNDHAGAVDLADEEGPPVLALYDKGGTDNAHSSLEDGGGHGVGEGDGVVGDDGGWESGCEESGFASLDVVVDGVPYFEGESPHLGEDKTHPH